MSILSTRVRAVEFLALMCVALSVAAPVAHLVTLPNKIGVPRDAYFVMQRVYDGPDFGSATVELSHRSPPSIF
jgi:hypothetical protein